MLKFRSRSVHQSTTGMVKLKRRSRSVTSPLPDLCFGNAIPGVVPDYYRTGEAETPFQEWYQSITGLVMLKRHSRSGTRLLPDW